MRKYILTETTNKIFKKFENEECTFSYLGGGATINFNNESIGTSRVLEIEVDEKTKNIKIKTKNSLYFLKRIEQ